MSLINKKYHDINLGEDCIEVKDIKEAIKELKLKLSCPYCSFCNFDNAKTEIEEIFGEELCSEKGAGRIIMKTNNKTYLNCGYEDNCKNKDCLKCPRRKRKSLSLTQAEETVIEDFAVCDLEIMVQEKPDDLELMQKIMMKVMKKVFREDKE